MTEITGFILYEPAGHRENEQQLYSMLRFAGLEDLNKQIYADSRFGIVQSGNFRQFNGVNSNMENSRFVQVVQGDIYNVKEIDQETVTKGKATEIDSHAIPILFEKYGEKVFHRLSGIYVVVLYDKISGTLHISNDRYAFSPLYVLKNSKGIFFSSAIKALFGVKGWSREINQRSVADLLNYHFILGDRTLLSGIELLPRATVLKVEDGRESYQSYWEYPKQADFLEKPFENLVDDCAGLLERAVKKSLSNLNHRLCITVSGGLDSRLLAGYATTAGLDPILYHFGVQDWNGTQIAQCVAKTLGLEFRLFDNRKIDFGYAFETGTKSGEGQYSVDQYIFYQWIEKISSECKYVLHGVGLDELLYPYIKDESTLLRRNISVDEMHKLLRSFFVFQSHAYFEGILEKEWFRRVRIYEGQNFKEELYKFEAEDLLSAEHFIYFNNRARRYVLGTPNVHRSQVQYRFPYMDYDLFDYCTRVPLRYKFKKEVHRAVFLSRFPKLAEIPYESTGVPLSSWKSRPTKIEKRVESYLYYLNRITHGTLDFGTPKWSFDYRFRNDEKISKYVRNTLLDPAALDLGLYTKKGIDNLFDNQKKGKNLYPIFSSLITLALFAKHILSGES